jgi:hypothetical protein
LAFGFLDGDLISSSSFFTLTPSSSREGIEKLTFSYLGGKSLLVKLNITGLQNCSEKLGIVSSLVIWLRTNCRKD